MEEAVAHDEWFRKEVQLALDEGDPDTSHDQVVADMRAHIEVKRRARNAR
jgi:hypothetical protein